MIADKFNLSNLATLLYLPQSDPRVSAFVAGEPILRDEYYGSIQYPQVGVEVVFVEAWSIAGNIAPDRDHLVVAAFHLHRQGHDGYAQYPGALPNDVQFNDDNLTLVAKMNAKH